MGVGNASVLMIAQRNPSACQALLAVGRVASCGGQRRVAYAAPQAQKVVYVKKAAYSSNKVAGGKKPRLQKVASAGGNCRWVTPATGRHKVQYCG
jgi:hypothetical protein